MLHGVSTERYTAPTCSYQNRPKVMKRPRLPETRKSYEAVRKPRLRFSTFWTRRWLRSWPELEILSFSSRGPEGLFDAFLHSLPGDLRGVRCQSPLPLDDVVHVARLDTTSSCGATLYWGSGGVRRPPGCNRGRALCAALLRIHVVIFAALP